MAERSPGVGYTLHKALPGLRPGGYGGIHFALSVAGGRISNVTLQRNEANGEGVSPFVELDRQTWSRLAAQMEQPLNEEDVVRLRGLGDPLDMKEVREVYLPLSRLLHLYVEAALR
jgi:type I pantothenate kinase